MTSTEFEGEPVPNQWLSTSGTYQGKGTAEFLDPRGCATGPATFNFDESGHCTVEMRVGQIEADDSLEMPEAQLFFGRGIVLHGVVQVGIGGGRQNLCTRLTVESPEGVLTATSHIGYGVRLSFGSEERAPSLRFSLFKSTFKALDGAVVRYWVLPLLNFVSSFHFRHPQLDHHPLRIYPTPAVNLGVTGNDAAVVNMRAHSKNHLVIFQFNGGPGFIEPLPDYEERVRRLEAGQDQSLITSVMVGEVGSNSTDFDELESWFPFHFLILLGLATGRVIGAPWIELRGSEGELVRRCHIRQGQPSFSDGRAAIKEGVHDNGIGYLLSRSLLSDEWKRDYVRVAARHAVRGGSYKLSIEDGLNHIFRALDILCEGYGQKKAVKPASLTQESARAVESAIDKAVTTITEFACQAERDNRDEEANWLRKVANQVNGAKNIQTGFGKAVLALLEKFQLQDAQIVERHYESSPRPDRRSWHDVLSYYRGITMHQGYFEFAAKHNIKETLAILEHLHDILVRILLRIVGYDGTYQPSMVKMATAARVDWVSPETPAERLGYRSSP